MTIVDIVKKNNALDFKVVGSYKQYVVYLLDFDSDSVVGLPVFALASTKETRLANDKETFELMKLLSDEEGE